MLDLDALASQSRLGRSALLADLMAFGVIANDDAELTKIKRWFQRNAPLELNTWSVALEYLKRNRLSGPRSIGGADRADLLPLGGLDTAYVTTSEQVVRFADAPPDGGVSAVTVNVIGGTRADLVDVDSFKETAIVRKVVQSHTSTIRKESDRGEFWQRIRPLACIADTIIIRDRYCLSPDGEPNHRGLEWLASQCAELPDRDRELVLYGTEAAAPFNSIEDYEALAGSLIEHSAHKLRRVCVIPIPRSGIPRGNASDRERPHQMPHDRVIRFATLNEGWSRRIVSGNSINVFEQASLNDDLTFSYRSLTPSEVNEEIAVEKRLDAIALGQYSQASVAVE